MTTPPLPKPFRHMEYALGHSTPALYTADQMRTYAAACVAAAQVPLSSNMRSPDGGPRFRVLRAGREIDDDDFIFDALLKIDGDFADDATRLAYATMLADKLNAAQVPLTTDAAVALVRDVDMQYLSARRRDAMMQILRTTERAHGIGEKT